ncbi:MAG: tRNA pseudouridine(38-40) synthase TruA [Ignavibacteriae bacterium]|nr:tRNA pseudouridine(38-40) synthase TruA [Ignavibacteriota bacterium]
MFNYKIKIAYDGTNYSGWQIQQNSISVQEKIKTGIEQITGEEVNLLGSGRTDSGVHAIGQTANFHLSKVIDKGKFLHSLNSVIPHDISILDIESVHKNFNSRFDAVSRSYIYIITTSKNPFYYKYSWEINWFKNYDLSKINLLSKIFIGKKDFTSFCRKNSDVENKICDLKEFRWKKFGDKIFIYVEANRFLHGMVRTLIGTVLLAAKNNYDEELIKNIIENKDRETAGEAVPARGLFLYKVRY